MKQPPRSSAGVELRVRPLVLALVCVGATPAIAQTLPTGMTQQAGTVAITPGTPAGTMSIVQGTDRAVANWESFSIGAGGTVNVAQPSRSSVLLNRVVGVDNIVPRSIIDGALNANGHVYLVNTSGVTFSRGSAVNVGGLVASTLGIADNAFMAGGKLTFTLANAENQASIINDGTITAAAGGVVALMGANVINSGIINVAQGSIGLLAAGTVTVDPVGDGLTTFTIPTDTKATQVLVAQVTNTVVEAFGSLNADGGRISMQAVAGARAQVVNIGGTLQARSLVQRGGEVILSARAVDGSVNPSVDMSLSGTIDVSGGLAGTTGGKVQAISDGTLLLNSLRIDASGTSGGSILTKGDYVLVEPSTEVDAAGTGTINSSNGNWTIESAQDITVATLPPFQSNSNSVTLGFDAGSVINADALSRALGRATDVTLTSHAAEMPFNDAGYSPGRGVTFHETGQIVKDAGRGASLRVNSDRDIRMDPGSSIIANVGALNVDFNADASGKALAADLPIYTGSRDGASGGAIAMESIAIVSNGGNIRFYGQSDPQNGRAVGSRTDRGDQEYGIHMLDTVLSTCPPGTTTCTGPGDILLRGQGTTGSVEGDLQSGVGVAVYSSNLRTGSGSITVDGRGGLGASGVRFENGGVTDDTPVSSATGNVRLVGSTRGWNAGESTTFFESDDQNDNGPQDLNLGAGVTLVDATISTGGSVSIEGTGADLTGIANDAGFRSSVLNFADANTATVSGSNGVTLRNTNINAGVGQQIAVSGKGGGGGFTVTVNATEGTDILFNTSPAYGVALYGQFGDGALRAEGGRIAIDGQGTDVALRYQDDVSEGSPLSMLSVGSLTRAGGRIEVRGANISITNDFEPTADFIDASGAGAGGTIDIAGTGAIGIDQNVGMQADAISASGNGGTIGVVAGGDLRTYGSYTARGGETGGNGGLVETSGGQVDVRGAQVDASAPAGAAGTWLVDPFDLNIVAGAANGSLPAEPFVPLANSDIQDGDINRAINTGTNVTIGTGAPDASSPLGTIRFGEGVQILLNTGTAPVTFRLDAARDILAQSGDTVIRGTSAALGVTMNAGVGGQTGALVYNGQMQTNGGEVVLSAIGNNTGQPCALCLNNSTVDTRVGGSDAGAGGNVTLSVPAPGTLSGNFVTAAIDVNATQISSATGNVTATGYSRSGTGVRVYAPQGIGGISTTSGSIALTGIGAATSNSAAVPGHGVLIDAAALRTVNGNIAVNGLHQGNGNGVLLRNGALVTSTGVGDISVAGESQGSGAGLLLTAASTVPSGLTVPASRIDGNRNVVLRAANNGSSDAIVLDGTVRAGALLNLRPGGVDAASASAVDRTANAITLDAGGTGFSISNAELGRVSAAGIVVGSNAHAGNIDVNTPVASSVPVTLQNDGGGNIALNAPLSAPTVGLLSAGNITQAGGAGISASSLLARSTGGSVILSDPANNVSANTLAGGAAGRFEFVNSGPLRIGSVLAPGWDAAGNLPQVQSTSSMAADTILVRTLSGDLLLDSNVSSTSGTDLVAAGTFQNVGGNSIGGAPWRVWADTWVGETRGGLAGSGQLPNLYHCAFGGLCTVTVSPGDNHFIYAQQPTATVTIGSFSRRVGEPNPNFGYTIDGLILGDRGVGFTGVRSTSATSGSPAGRYPIFGTFTSAEGYAINVVPGTLDVLGALLVDPARFIDVLRDEPTTWIYDRNIAQAPICVATGPLQGDRAQQDGDVLAREWSRVRTRPNLTSCVDTERHNGCADF